MSRKSGFRATGLAFGLCLAAVVAVGANRLFGDGGAQPTRPSVPSTPSQPGGVIVLGTVGPDPVQVGPPAVAAMATVTKVMVTDGDTVQPGDPLVQFDDRIYQAKLAQAQAELRAAEPDVTKAEVAIQVHAAKIGLQELAVKATRDDITAAEDGLKATRDALDRVLNAERDINTNQPLDEAEKQRRRDENAELQTAEHLVIQLQNKLAADQKTLALMKLDPVEATREQASAKVDRLKATVAEAETAVDLCLVKAPLAGVVEQLFASPGMTYGPSTRSPLMWMIPAGGLVVRAEVEAEFADRVAGSKGQAVTIYDSNNFALTYDGTVTRVGTAFLPKRTVGEVLAVSPSTRVLECTISVADPAPAGRPPLRVGQPVRIAFP